MNTPPPHSCPECGAIFAVTIERNWTPVAILDACRAWGERFGSQPKATSWANAAPDHPSSRTVIQQFGSWGAMIAAAGYVPRQGPIIWPRERIVEAFGVWRDEHGRWPTQREWSSSTRTHPHFHTVRNLFGSWDAGRRAAGYRGRGRATIKSLTAKSPERIGMVNAAPIAEVVRREAASRPLAAIAADCDVDESYLSMIVRGSAERVGALVADKILVALDRPHVFAEAAA